MSFELFLGYYTGLVLIDNRIAFQTLVYTAILIHFCDGIICRVFAGKDGYSRNMWMLYGSVFGVWAILGLVFFPMLRERVTKRQ